MLKNSHRWTRRFADVRGGRRRSLLTITPQAYRLWASESRGCKHGRRATSQTSQAISSFPLWVCELDRLTLATTITVAEVQLDDLLPAKSSPRRR